MRDVLGPGTILGYCTNVHAGATLDAMLANLDRYAVAVRQRVSGEQPMGVGLWLPASVASQLQDPQELRRLREFLQARALLPFSFNGFPFGDFHQQHVKHRVYHPTWCDPARLHYTLDLARILAQLIGEGEEGSISTLPLGWRADLASLHQAPAQYLPKLLALVEALAELEHRTGRVIHVDLEPEPGCVLDCCQDVLDLFARLYTQASPERVRRHLRVCHDVCHSAVMFEDQVWTLQKYRESGIRVGKVQISSAVSVPFDEYDPGHRRAALEQLSSFAEDRYLHQTVVGSAGGQQRVRFFDDLPDALRELGGELPEQPWRVHFHVPLHLERAGELQTTQAQTRQLLAAVRQESDVRHFEVETYAWGVLPEHLRRADLAAGIADEMQWVCDTQRR